MTQRPTGAADEVRVFLSWSGEPSKLLAEALAEGMRALSPRLEPWLSDDLDPGEEWASTLIPQIRKAQLAILCLTHRNVNAPWIAFETGAYYTSRLRKGVIPFLLDLPPGELEFPLGLFQSLRADWKGTKALFIRLGKLVDLGADEVENALVTKLWRQLSDQMDAIRGIPPPRTDEPGNWKNVANAFFLGHDLRWTIDVLTGGGPVDDVKHGLIQILHQAHELGLSQHNHFLILAREATEALKLPGDSWTPEVRDKLETCLKLSFERIGGLVINRQPGYRPYDPENQKTWLAMQAAGRA
jgi:hypothetical protein